MSVIVELVHRYTEWHVARAPEEPLFNTASAGEDIVLDDASDIFGAFDIFVDWDVGHSPKRRGTERKVSQAARDVGQECRSFVRRQCGIACTIHACEEYLAYKV